MIDLEFIYVILFLVSVFTACLFLNTFVSKYILLHFPSSPLALSRSNIRCEKDGIRFLAKPADFPRWNGDELTIGTCRLNKDFTGFASYEKCQIKAKERR